MKKIKTLIWGDAPPPLCYTGFGTVIANIWNPLYKTEKFDIYQIAINYHGDFYEKTDCPWQLVPARLRNPNDPHGVEMFLRAVDKEDFDLIWIVNDTAVTIKAVENLNKILNSKKQDKRKLPKIIYYYPVDSQLKPHYTGMIETVDQPVAYSLNGFNETIKYLPHLKDKVKIIHHGVNSSNYIPYSKEIIAKLKKEIFNLEPDSYLIVNINRNTMRKQLWRSLEAFKKFRETVPNSYLYLHTNPVEKNINLLDCAASLDLDVNKDIYFPPNYSPQNGYPEELMNRIWNCGDLMLTTSLDEGWGLSTVESMSCGVPVVATSNSVNPEIIGIERGYLYPTKEYTVIDPAGIRPIGLISDIVDKMLEAYNDGWKHDNKKVIRARKWAEAHDWSIINKQWLDLIENLLNKEDNNTRNMIIGDEL